MVTLWPLKSSIAELRAALTYRSKARPSIGSIIVIWLILACLFNVSNAAVTHSWDFKSVTSNEFVDSSTGTKFNISEPTNYIDNDYGVHLAHELLQITSADLFQDQLFTIYGTFYAHKNTDFYLFWEQNGIVDRFCLSADSSGNYALSMVNSEANEQHLTTSLSAFTGWTFFSVKVQYVYGKTEMTLTVANENNSPTTKLSEIVTFDGVYTKDVQTFNIGCRVVNSVCTNSLLGAIRDLYIDDTVVDDTTLDALYDTTCTDDGVSACGICMVSGTAKCFEVLEGTPKIKYLNLDITSTTTASTTVSDLSGDSHDFSLSTSAPYRIPLQGYKFEKDMHLVRTTGFALPNSFTINTWFRINTGTSIPDSQMQYLFLKSDNTGPTDKFYIGVTNSYLRIYLDGAVYDYAHSFSSNNNWRYLSVSFYTISSSATGIQIFLDGTKLSEQSIPKVYSDSAAYYLYVGKDLEGNIYSFEIVPMLFVDLSAPPLLFTGTCTAYGSTSSCTVCPKTTTSAGTCLSHCGLGTYDNTCSDWDWKCGYCTAAGANCITCATALEGTGAAPRTCTCRSGYYDNTTSCEACDSLCGTCTGAGSTSCSTCANDAYSHGSNTCVSSCPTYFTENTNYRRCDLDTTSFLTYVYDPTSQANGCTSSQYWDGSACQSCHAECLTCSGATNSDCLSCGLGRYQSGTTCPVWDATDMTVGSSGICVETCGKSKNFGLLECDNGGAAGCTSCTVEDGYSWSGGTSTAPDVCTYNYASFSSVNVTDDNNIYVYFDREMQAVGSVTDTTFEITVTDANGNNIEDVGWEVPSDYYTQYSEGESARYIFIGLYIPGSLKGGDDAATVTVKYQYASGNGTRDNF